MNNQNSINLKNKKILLTGGLGILGKAIVKELLKNNAKILIIDKKKIGANSNLIKNRNIKFYNIDITDFKKIENLSKNKEFSNLYGIINNAAIDSPPVDSKISNKKVFLEDINECENNIFTNIKLYLYVTKIFGEILYNKKKGNILNISSIYGMGSPDQDIYLKAGMNFIKPLSYTISKSSIYGFTKYMCHYFRNTKVRINTLSLSGIYNNQNKNFIDLYKKKIPLNRMMNKSEAAKTVCFMMSDYSSYINGTNLIVDGGYFSK
jgi:NAD(P)-dependent dehydrogenase (short-subunit alcohol dehydrogenase family)